MRTVALVSGGKDSCYNMMQCVAAGHTIVALANLQPQHKDELDSYMYQTVGHQGIELYAEAMGLPLYREVITGVAVDQSRNYKPTENDEVEDLYRLLSRVKDELSIEAVSVGAILSDYQRIRVENVCRRLGLVSLAYLWRRNQKELLQEMIDSKVEAIIIKVAALGLTPAEHLGRSLSSMHAPLRALRTKYGLNVCGEGGEYETFTLDCPLFRKRLVVDEKEVVIHSNDPVAPVGYLNLKLHLEPKDESELQMPPSVRSPLDFVNELSDSAFSDISDKELSETEMESIEKLEAEKMKGEGVKSLSYTELNDEKSDGEENESLESIEDGYAERDYELPPVVDHRSIYGNDHGWYFIGGIVGEGTDTAEATEVALQKLISLLSTEELSLPDVCSVNIYMRDMEDYSVLNEAYASHFCFENPPTRVCVQCPLPDDVGLIMDAVAFRPVASNQDSDGAPKTRHTMHVQGISHWAPANIGPYSQAFKIGEAISTCGVIALVAGSLALCHGGPRAQCGLALTHLARLIRAIAPRATIRSVVQSVCYTVCVGAVAASRRAFERRTAGSLAQFAVVGALPRKAGVEWHAWAHTGNYRFEYEETGCDIGDYKVAITRRWNYDNTVSAFVCYVATGSSPSTHQVSLPAGPDRAVHRQRAASVEPDQLRQAMDYALGKLLADRKPGRTAVTVRVFYQASSAPSPSALSALLSAAAEARAAATAVPVLALHNGLTFLSIAGLRIDE